MTRVILRGQYIGHGVRGAAGHVVDLPADTAADLVAAGRATLADRDRAEPRAKRTRRKTDPADDPFLNPGQVCAGNEDRPPRQPTG